MADRCKHPSCQAEIVFARVMTTGNIKPFDAKPTPAGEWILERDLFGELAAEHLPARLRAGATLHTSHFATCPAAAEFRRRAAR